LGIPSILISALTHRVIKNAKNVLNAMQAAFTNYFTAE